MAKDTVKSGLSPVPYLRHNKGRTSALIVSLSVFAMMIYVTGYLLGTTIEPFTIVMRDPYKRFTIMAPVIDDFEYETTEEWDATANILMHEKRDEASAILNTDDVFVVKRGFAQIYTLLGETSTMIYYFDNTSDVERFSQHMDAVLVSGRMPEAPGELLVDRKCIANAGERLLSKISDSYTIVGEVDSPYYLVYGLPVSAENNYWLMVFNESEETGYVDTLTESGMELAIYQDLNSAGTYFEDNIGILDDITALVSTVAGVILCICVLVILSLHIKDRHEEWCLLNSIGFSVGEIYTMGTMELLICFAAALVSGALLSAVMVFLMKTFITDPMGLPVKVIRPGDMAKILIMFLAVFSLCQIPLFVRMKAITTVDDIE